MNFGAKQEEFNNKFKQLMAEKRANRKSRMVLGIWGEPKTGKTGIALDFPDRKIYVLDWDSGVESTWIECHEATERIEVFDPIVQDKDNKIDITESENNSHDFIRYVRGKIEEGEKPIFVMDGVDTWFDKCIYKVNPHEAEKYVDNTPAGIKPAWKDWGGKLEQEIHCSKRKVKGEIHFVAELIGSRTNGNKVGTRWTIREGTPPNIVWNGIPDLQEGKI